MGSWKGVNGGNVDAGIGGGKEYRPSYIKRAFAMWTSPGGWLANSKTLSTPGVIKIPRTTSIQNPGHRMIHMHIDHAASFRDFNVCASCTAR